MPNSLPMAPDVALNQNIRITNRFGARAVSCFWHMAEAFANIFCAEVAGGTSEVCDRCRQDLDRARHAGEVRVALCDPKLSHTRARNWCGVTVIYIYHRDATSPTGVKLAAGCQEPMYYELLEELRAAGARLYRGSVSPLSPTEGL